LQPGKPELTPEQEAEARRFAEESIRRQLSTEPVDEQETVAFLRQAYEVAGLAPPQSISWFDGPFPLVVDLAPDRVQSLVGDDVWPRVFSQLSAWVEDSLTNSLPERLWNTIQSNLFERLMNEN
jgi:hypothetical protein